jgi:hypothetical protein
MQFLLEVLVHHVDHPVAKPPEGEERDEQGEGKENAPAAFDDEHAFLGGTHSKGNRVAGEKLTPARDESGDALMKEEMKSREDDEFRVCWRRRGSEGDGLGVWLLEAWVFR